MTIDALMVDIIARIERFDIRLFDCQEKTMLALKG